MSNSLKNKIALVTGGGRGSGRSIAERLAEEGAIVAINYRNDVESANETLRNIDTNGGVGKIFKASIDDENEAKAMVDQIKKEFGVVDILINNAGIAS